MNRREFFKAAAAGAAGVALAGLAGAGCVAPGVSPAAFDAAQGAPWRCENCGHLTRSNEDLSGRRCPRCYQRELKRITEDQMRQYLAAADK